MKRQRITGRELQKAIIQLAHQYGWTCAHFASVPITRRGKTYYATPAEADGKGWPDLFLVRGGRALAIEVKGDGDTVKGAQKKWLDALRGAGIEAVVIDVAAWETGIAEKVLA